MKKFVWLTPLMLIPLLIGGSALMKEKKAPMNKAEEEWCRLLTPEEYRILRQKGTERPFSGKFWNNHKEGVYRCAACGNELFSSKTKFESGTGWPSFWEPAGPDRVRFEEDSSHFMKRTEVLCSHCGGHLGHLFDDGPEPTGKRFCINSRALKFEAKK